MPPTPYLGEVNASGMGYGKQLIAKSPNMTEILTAKKERLEFELAEVNEALEAMRANPAIERVINLITKIRH